MPRRRIVQNSGGNAHFLTFTVSRWYYIFDRHNRWPILADTIEHAKQHSGVRVYGFVFMLNHVHLIASSPDCAAFARDFKSVTAHKLRKNLAATEPTILDLFRKPDGGFQFWQAGNAPKAIETEAFFLQKLRYILENPVRKQYVTQPEHWYWSSANLECSLQPDPW